MSVPVLGPLALHEAAKSGDIEKARRLLTEGELVACADQNAKTPLVIAAENGHVEMMKFLGDCSKIDFSTESGAVSKPAASRFHN